MCVATPTGASLGNVAANLAVSGNKEQQENTMLCVQFGEESVMLCCVFVQWCAVLCCVGLCCVILCCFVF